MPNTHSLAAHDPSGQDDSPGSEEAEDTDSSEKYFAVLVLDGDGIGQWVSGAKAPPFASQLADYPDGSSAQRFGSKPYFEKPEFKDFLRAPRPLSPSYHLQFSEALTNFALRCVQAIVEAFDGRLTYAGGDDVVALLPADTAVSCAKALRLAFTGSPAVRDFLEQHARLLRARHESQQQGDRQAPSVPHYQKRASERCLLDCEAPGFVCRLDHVDQQDRPIPFLVPGPAADCSVGIAIGHFKAPLQDVVRAAQDAERRAKGQLGRSAVAITLFKRSGETIEWGTKWESGGLELYDAIAGALDAGKLSGKFPYRVIELLDPYRTSGRALAMQDDANKFDAAAVIEREFAHAVSRQSASGQADVVRADLGPKLTGFLTKIAEGWDKPTPPGNRPAGSKCQQLLAELIGLCQTVAFAHRTRSQQDAQP